MTESLARHGRSVTMARPEAVAWKSLQRSRAALSHETVLGSDPATYLGIEPRALTLPRERCHTAMCYNHLATGGRLCT